MAQRLTVYIPDKLDERLRDLAAERGQTLTTLVTRLLQAALKRESPEHERHRHANA